jgi:hypothetical protein
MIVRNGRISDLTGYPVSDFWISRISGASLIIVSICDLIMKKSMERTYWGYNELKKDLSLLEKVALCPALGNTFRRINPYLAPYR